MGEQEPSHPSPRGLISIYNLKEYLIYAKSYHEYEVLGEIPKSNAKIPNQNQNVPILILHPIPYSIPINI